MSDESTEAEPSDQLNRSSRSVHEPSPETLAELSVLNASIDEAEQFELTFEIVDNTKKKDEDTNEDEENVAVVDVYGFEVEADEEEEDRDKENTDNARKVKEKLPLTPSTPSTKKNADSSIFSEQRKRKIYLTSTPKTKRVHK